jgi:hypothetical protein
MMGEGRRRRRRRRRSRGGTSCRMPAEQAFLFSS